MKDKIYTYIYRVSMGVLVLSSALMFFVLGTAPFGVSASWSTEGFGTSLVFMRSDATATIGQKMAGMTELQGKVAVFTVEEILRREGAVFYRVSGGQGGELATMPASELGRTALLSVPFIGFFAQMLNNMLGVMTLVGLPLVMLFINYALLVLQRIAPIVSSLERSAQEKRHIHKEAIQQRKEESFEFEEESVRDDEYVTVLKPYNLRGAYSH